jgi:rod shape determining protein RodA
MIPKRINIDLFLVIPVLFTTVLSVIILRSISPSLFPLYFIYIFLGLVTFLIFSKIDYRITETFSPVYYVVTIILLLLTLVIGKVTRGTVRWIPLGGFSIQPAEVLRPFLMVFFSYFYAKHRLNLNTISKAFILVALPAFLIFIQPSLSVTIITLVGFLGITLSVGFNKKILIGGALLLLTLIPLVYLVMAPYQRERISTFLNPNQDPLGSGYNSIQSTISVGSGKIVGRGLGKGVQTQLAFLPERHTDFVFASISEELGFLGAMAVILSLFAILYRLTVYIEKPISPSARAFTTGVFFALSTQILVNVAMNLGIMPVAGLPLPIISAGGSSFLGTMILLGIASSTKS